MKQLFKKLSAGESLNESETLTIFEAMMGGEGEISDALIGAYLMAIGRRLPTADELVGGATALRKHMNKVELKNFNFEGGV